MMAYAPAGAPICLPVDGDEDDPELGSLDPSVTEIGRFARAPLCIAIAMFGMVCVAIPVALGFPWPIVVGGCLLVGCLILSLTANDTGRKAPRYATHGAFFFAIAVLASAVFYVGVPPVVTVYCSGVMMLAGAHLLGARVTVLWSFPTVGLTAAAVLFPPEQLREIAPLATILSRNGALLTMVALAVAFRRASDRRSVQLIRNATTDALTGLTNRRGLGTALTDALQRSARSGRQGAVVSIDIDGLKAVNDTLGHEAGDALIKVVADRIASSVREIDTAARLGGDEFVVLLSEYDERDGATVFARRLLNRLSEPCEVGGETLEPSASMGIAHFPGASSRPDELMHRADEAMYEAKRAGGRRIVSGDDQRVTRTEHPTARLRRPKKRSLQTEGKSATGSALARGNLESILGPSKLPVYCALAMFGLLTIVLPLVLGLPGLSIIGMLLVACLGYALWTMDSGHPASHHAFHVAYFLSLFGVAYAVFGRGLSPVLTVYIPAMMLLAAAHLLGAKAAFVWVVPTIAASTAAVLFPPAEPEMAMPPLLLALVRSGTLFTILAFAVAFRQSSDRQSAQLLRSASTDPLTGLANRRAIVRAIGDALARTGRHGRGALVMIDFDGLKDVNDRLGHEAGDDLLRAAADCIASSIREVDVAARLGGDEFVVLLAEYDVAHGAEAFARRLLKSFSEPCLVGGEMITSSASIGIAYFPSSSNQPDDLLQRADEAMYQAKRAGGGRIVSC